MLELQGDVASDVLGWISIACWIIVYSPQIIENYQLQNGEGLSLLFVYIWLLGDICNLCGAVLAHLLPTIIILGVYYTLCDTTLLLQVYYYRWRERYRGTLLRAEEDSPTEQSCLLGDNALVHGSESRSTSVIRVFTQYAAAVAFVMSTGVVAYLISGRIQHEDGSGLPPDTPLEWRIQVLGWTSALLYLGARVPQISKNFKTRCEGLAPGLFLFAILGNLTYALSIVAVSMERDYLIRNGSWLAGSALTVFLDLIVLCQFFYYGFVSRQRGWIDEMVG
ncbi:PQ-loop-domain-containing protein [Boletus edulis]|uniref:PQ-loop-domain-containing protein n=1 Tax=Boletus edulis BED1 TaxID=1328754 RepID=A0AAD4BXP7_BOLED|nr:PQ-loop-domain-containing protein [Boletus edulis]KAF8442926.1 PQ-loop-domain-containing protein [Boletus edulis BED1]